MLALRRAIVVTAISLFVAGTSSAREGRGLRYPETRRVDHVDTYHGVEVRDPYRWLEADVRESDEVAAWVAAQSKLAFDYLDRLPARDAIEARLTELWDYEKQSTPSKVAGRYVYSGNDGLQNQSVLYMMEELVGEPRVLIDPNGWSEDGTTALAGTSFSDDGRYLAYGVASSGSDWRTWRIMEVASGKVLTDELRWVKFSSPTWTKDGRGFFYGAFDAPAEGAAFQSLNLNHKLYYHRVGTPQADDVLVHQNPEHPTWGFGAKVTEDGRYLVITVWKGTDDNARILFKDLAEPYGMPVALIQSFDDVYKFIGNDGPVFFFKTDRDAPRSRVIAIDVRRPEPESWREVIPQAEEALRSVSLVGNLFVARYLKDAKSRVLMYDMAGTFVREVAFPGVGKASGFGGRRGDSETFYRFESFATPPTTYRYDLLTGKSEVFHRVDVAFEPSEYVVEQVFYESADGTRVPMFLAHKKGLVRDGSNPTLLYGYGGFDIPQLPAFRVDRLQWMEMGGLFAMASLRGGGEYGEDWHKAGTKLRKQNVFDDFIAAAEWLIDEKYTHSNKLGVQGRSNGGLLIGAVMTQRPELFGACLPAVGVMDMLRFQHFTAGRYWVDDYGSSADPAEFRALLAYSPYHNLKPGVSYPPTLVTTADTDDRVVPGHSFKFAAALQRAQAGQAPVLIRIETRAGHGAGTPTSKKIRLVADEWAFLVEHLGLTLSPRAGRGMPAASGSDEAGPGAE